MSENFSYFPTFLRSNNTENRFVQKLKTAAATKQRKLESSIRRRRFLVRQVKCIMYATLTPTRSGGHKQAFPSSSRIRRLEPEDTPRKRKKKKRWEARKQRLYSVYRISSVERQRRRRGPLGACGEEVICMTALFFSSTRPPVRDRNER